MSKERVMLLIDADNVSVDIIEQAVRLLHKQHGGVHVRRAYCTAEGALKHQAAFKRLGIKPMVNLATGKNSTDIALAVDAIDLVLAERPDVVVIASSDSDFAPLVQRLREKGCEVRGIGQKGKTGDETQEVYDDYTVLEHRRPAAAGSGQGAVAARGAAHKAAPATGAKPARKSSRAGRGRDRAAVAPEMALPPEAAARPGLAPAPTPAPEPAPEPLFAPAPAPAPEPTPEPAAAPAPAAAPVDTAVATDADTAATPRRKPAARKTTSGKTARKSTTAAAKQQAAADAVGAEPPQPAVPVDAAAAAAAAPASAAKTPRTRAPRKTAAAKSAAAKAPAAAAAPAVEAPAAAPWPEPAPEAAPAPAPTPARAAAAPMAAPATADVHRGGASADAGGTRGTSVDAVLDCLPELRAGQSLALNVAVQRLREAQLLGRNSSSLKLFSQLGPRFELLPTGKPSLVRLRG